MTSVGQLVKDSEFKMLLLKGGEGGLYRQLSGVNVIESVDLIPFCRPNELIITTGIHLDKDSKQLDELIMKAFEKRAAGFIINTGPYIPKIPSSISRFADEKNFPIFELEWKYRIADLLKSTFEFLSAKQNLTYQNQTDEKLLHNLIFRYNDFQFPDESIEKRGFPKGSELGIITCTTPSSSQNSIHRYESVIFYEFQKRYHRFLALKHNNQLIFLINRQEVLTAHIPFSKTVEKIYEKVIEINGHEDLIISMGNFSTHLKDISKSYNESLTVIHIVEQHKNPFIQKYKEIGVYKLLMSLSDQSIIKQFQQDMLGPLYMYDYLHNTDFIRFLRIFLDEEGSTVKISKRLFIHRNTVNYKIKKIETLLDVNLNHTFTRTNLNVALMIEDILSQNFLPKNK